MSVLNQKMDEQMPYFKRVPGGEEGGALAWGRGCHTHAAALQLLKLRLKWKLERHKVCHRYSGTVVLAGGGGVVEWVGQGTTMASVAFVH